MKFNGLMFSINKNFDMKIFWNSLNVKLKELDLAIGESKYWNNEEDDKIKLNMEVYYLNKDIEQILSSIPLHQLVLSVMMDYKNINEEPYCKFDKIEF